MNINSFYVLSLFVISMSGSGKILCKDSDKLSILCVLNMTIKSFSKSELRQLIKFQATARVAVCSNSNELSR